jgi:hypothetical protein
MRSEGKVYCKRSVPPNGLELSCPAAQATAPPFSRIPAGKSRSNFPHAGRVSCSELLGSARIRSYPVQTNWPILQRSSNPTLR